MKQNVNVWQQLYQQVETVKGLSIEIQPKITCLYKNGYNFRFYEGPNTLVFDVCFGAATTGVTLVHRVRGNR